MTSVRKGQKKINILFVCLGNICRSPMAEAVFRDLVRERRLNEHFEITSAGTGSWHEGEPPHHGTRATLKRHGIDPDGLFAKQVSQAMLDRADYVLAMDDENLSDLRAWRVDQHKLSRLLDHTTGLETRNVPDPYYDGRFELVYELVRLGSEGLLQDIQASGQFEDSGQL